MSDLLGMEKTVSEMFHYALNAFFERDVHMVQVIWLMMILSTQRTNRLSSNFLRAATMLDGALKGSEDIASKLPQILLARRFGTHRRPIGEHLQRSHLSGQKARRSTNTFPGKRGYQPDVAGKTSVGLAQRGRLVLARWRDRNAAPLTYGPLRCGRGDVRRVVTRPKPFYVCGTGLRMESSGSCETSSPPGADTTFLGDCPATGVFDAKFIGRDASMRQH